MQLTFSASPGEQEVYHTPVLPQQRILLSRLSVLRLLKIGFAFVAAEPFVIVFRNVNFLAVLAHLQWIFFVGQHERKHHVNALVQGMEVPPEDRFLSQQDDIAGC